MIILGIFVFKMRGSDERGKDQSHASSCESVDLENNRIQPALSSDGQSKDFSSTMDFNFSMGFDLNAEDDDEKV